MVNFKYSSGERIKVYVACVDPAIAEKWLSHEAVNRELRQHVVDGYTSMMKRGEWGFSESAICFMADGGVINGQHRLWAVIQSETSQRFIIAEGFERADIHYMDDSFKRKNVDTYNLTHDTPANTQQMAIARVLNGGQEMQGALKADNFKRLEEHQKAIAFACDVMSPKRAGLTQAPVCAVIARAFYTADLAKIRRFGEVLLTGGYSNEVERTVLLLRDYLLSTPSGQRDARVEHYQKTERALLAFLRDETLKSLYAASDEQFPLPGELKPSRARGGTLVRPVHSARLS
jgi:hypothetical protein